MTFLSNLNWRYATKKFDSAKKVESAALEKILESVRLTPTSFGLQAYHFFVITNQDIKDKIQAVAWNQPQVWSCSHLLVFCARLDLENVKNEYFDGLSGGNSEVRAQFAWYEQMVTWFLPNASPEWAKKQVYIAQGFALAACAELQIDSCPMEWFDPSAVTSILWLDETLSPVVLLPIGYRSSDENPRPKFRFSKEKLFTFID